MYVHKYMYIYIYTHTYIYMHMYIYICMHIYLNIWIYTYTCLHIYIYIYIDMITYIYIYIHVYIYINICTYICVKSRMWMSHVTHTKDSYDTYEWVMSQITMSRPHAKWKGLTTFAMRNKACIFRKLTYFYGTWTFREKTQKFKD